MKQIACKSVAVVVLALFAGESFATSGKLNGSGCHNSRKAGYHCHKAQPTKKAVAAGLAKSVVTTKPSKPTKPAKP